MSQKVPPFADLLADCRKSAVHLEMRDTYAVDYESGDFRRWRETGKWDNLEYWKPWKELVSEAVGRGVIMRRARIISEPVSEYIRFEYSGTIHNIEAGELVRWLPRRQASDLALPGNDFWLFDDQLVEFNHFTGDGASAGPSLSDDPDVVKLCSAAFESVWQRATPHGEFKV